LGLNGTGVGASEKHGYSFRPIDRDNPALLPPKSARLVPDDHLVHFILDAVAALDLRRVKVNERGTGSEQYPPTMMLALLIYSYATGTFGSRRIEQSTYDSVPVRLLTADTHPDHDTICTFRRENQALLTESFVQVLQLAQQLKVLQVGQITVAVDGTKVLANASNTSAVSYERAGQMIAQLELEVGQLIAKAEQADSTPLQDGLTIPQEITRRQERKAALTKARAEIEARAQARYAIELAEHEKKNGERAAKQERGEKVGGKPPKAPTPEPGPGDQYNFTDSESRIMKAGNGNHFEQSYNAQAAVDVRSRLIMGGRMSQSPTTNRNWLSDLQAIPAAAGSVEAVLIDSGFYSESAVRAVEQRRKANSSGTTRLCGNGEKRAITATWPIWKGKQNQPRPPRVPVWSEVMKYRLATAAGSKNTNCGSRRWNRYLESLRA